MIKVYNTLSRIAFFKAIIVIFLLFSMSLYIYHAVTSWRLVVPIGTILIGAFTRNFLLLPPFLFVLYIMSKSTGCIIMDEGIGLAKFSKNSWVFMHYAEWKNITAIKYKPSKIKFLGYDRLLIYRDDKEFKVLMFKRNYMVIDNSQRDFKEIVDIVCEKTKLPLEMYSK